MLRSFLVLLVSLSLLACTTTQSLRNPSPQRIQEQVRVGDRVNVFTKSGQIYTIKVTGLGERNLMGQDQGNLQPVQVPYADIRQVQSEKISVGKSLGLGTLTILAVGGFMLIKAIGDGFD